MNILKFLHVSEVCTRNACKNFSEEFFPWKFVCTKNFLENFLTRNVFNTMANFSSGRFYDFCTGNNELVLLFTTQYTDVPFLC